MTNPTFYTMPKISDRTTGYWEFVYPEGSKSRWKVELSDQARSQWKDRDDGVWLTLVEEEREKFMEHVRNNEKGGRETVPDPFCENCFQTYHRQRPSERLCPACSDHLGAPMWEKGYAPGTTVKVASTTFHDLGAVLVYNDQECAICGRASQRHVCSVCEIIQSCEHDGPGRFCLDCGKKATQEAERLEAIYRQPAPEIQRGIDRKRGLGLDGDLPVPLEKHGLHPAPILDPVDLALAAHEALEDEFGEELAAAIELQQARQGPQPYQHLEPIVGGGWT